MIHINVNQVGIYLIPIYNQVGMIPNLQNFRAQLFKIQNDSVSDGTFGTGLGGLLRGLIFPLGVTLSNDES